jgi:hypothetical protein
MEQPTPQNGEPVREAVIRERLEAESPDGRPPTPKVRRESRTLFWVILSVVTVGALASLYWAGGAAPVAVAVVLVIGFIGLAAWPAWHAAMDRKVDRDRAEREVRGVARR